MRRPRLLAADAGGPASRRFPGVAVLAALAAYAALVAAVATRPGLGPFWPLALGACVFGPLPAAIGTSRMRRFLGFDAPPAPVFTLVSLAGVVALGAADRALVLPAALTALQGHLLVALHDDRSAVWSAPCSALLALSALVVSASGSVSTLGAVLVPVALSASLAAQLLLAARRTRRLVATRSLSRAAEPETAAGATRRIAYAIPLAAALVVFALLAAPFARTPPWRLLDGSGRRGDGSRPVPAENRGRRGDGAEGFAFSDEVASGAIPIPAYEVIAEVVPRDGPRLLGNVGPLHLRGVVLSQMTQTGARLRDTRLPTRRLDAEDGVADDRVELRRDIPASGTLTLEISHYPLPIEPEGWSLLFSLEPLYAVGLADIRYDPDRLLVATTSPDDWFTYTVLGARPGASLARVGGAAAAHPDGRFVQLPPATPALQRVTDLGRTITTGVTTDLARVQAVTTYFRTGFEYTLEETTQPGVLGLVEFLDRRAGYCSHYALASVLMLRAQGLPARVVTGFLASEWSDTEAAYQVRPRDTHAWFEVHFDGVGWVSFDATPPDVRQAAIERDTDEPGAAAWAGSLLDRVGAMVRGDGAGVSFTDVLAVLRAAPASVLRALAALLAGLVAVALLLRMRAFSRARAAPQARARREVDDVYGRILAALARRGHRKAPAATPREFAARTAHAGGVGYRPLIAITEDLYAVRFGDRPLEPELRARVDDFVRALRRD